MSVNFLGNHPNHLQISICEFRIILHDHITNTSSYSIPTQTPDHQIEIWTKPLMGGSFAVVFFSRAEDIPRPVTITPSQLGFNHTAGYIMYDLFDHQHLGHFMDNQELELKVNPSGVVMLRGDPAHGKTKLDHIKTNKVY